MRKSWKCGKTRLFKKDYRSTNVEIVKGFDDDPSREGKVSLEGGVVHLTSTSTHSDHDT